MSSLSFHTIISRVDSRPDWYAERSFLGLNRSLENQRTFSSFELLGFSISYELDYPHIPEILRAGRIPPFAALRDERHPLVIAGGMAPTLNPEPIADFMDAIVLGEAEEVLPPLLRVLGERGRAGRRDILQELSRIKGVYIPSLHQHRRDKRGGLVRITPAGEAPFPLSRGPLARLDKDVDSSVYLTGSTTFPWRPLLEISRGCPGRCRFCAAGYLHSSVRHRSPEAIFSRLDTWPEGIRRVGLIASSVGHHPGIEKIIAGLALRGFSSSVSSLRADSLSAPLLQALAEGGQRTITMAPETGSHALRRRLHKDIPDELFAEGVELARRCGLRKTKLYFLVGLPGETGSDLDALVSFSRRLARIMPLAVSINPFIPKPHTPLQWAALDNPANLKKKLAYLMGELRPIGGVLVRAGSVRQAIISAAISRGDRRMGSALDKKDWAALRQTGDPFREREPDEFFPWDIIRAEIPKSRLRQEYEAFRT